MTSAVGSQPVLALRWRLVPGVVLRRTGSCTIDVEVTGRRLPLRFRDERLTDAMATLDRGATESQLEDAAAAITDGAARVHLHLIRLLGVGLLELDVVDARGLVATVLPRTPSFRVPERANAPARLVLSRFAYLRRTERGLLLAAPDATADVVLGADGSGAAWIAQAAAPMQLGDGVTDETRDALLRLLLGLGLVVDADAPESAAQQTWEFHDRLFHRAARSYADFVPRGGTYRFSGKLAPLPGVRPAYPGLDVPLPVPPPGDRSSGGLRDVMERRRSRRAMGPQRVTLEDVAELLYRVARITEFSPGTPYDVVQRPYPSGGAVHELEFYVAIGNCEGLDAGFYHYRSAEHALTRLEHGDAGAAAMLTQAAHSWSQPDEPPQALIVISSRLPRLAWKYEGIAYKISLLNAGTALQSLALVAEDLGLHAAASGSGDPDLFGAATGVDSFAETSIAEFGFGRGAEKVSPHQIR